MPPDSIVCNKHFKTLSLAWLRSGIMELSVLFRMISLATGSLVSSNFKNLAVELHLVLHVSSFGF